jgi:hypothetical protein
LLYLLAIIAVAISEAAISQSTVAHASSGTSGTFISFSTFLKSVSTARYDTYAAYGQVRNEQSFAEMRSYVLGTYAGVQTVSSYVLDGEYFDCITVDSQPSVRHLHLKHLATPPQVETNGTTANSALNSASPLTQGLKDQFGNAISCPDGTIPMQRITLERLSKFPSLQAFLAKEPVTQNGASSVIQPGGPHRYAHAYQYVTNYGGNSWLNLWNPSGDFTLSQHWYVGGSGSSLQTVEGGWVHYPAKFGSQSVLFIYFTPDNYGHGCYNLDCTGFVQTNKNWALGGKWSNYSTYGGTQYGFTMQWKYYNGNWWLFLQGSGNIESVGYYPGSIYNGGQLASNAQRVDYGGETYTGGISWPQMGSGKFASAGWQQAAFQKTIFYISQNQSGGSGVWTSLNPVQNTPACYTINVTPYTSGGSWGTYFFYGGAGGVC